MFRRIMMSALVAGALAGVFLWSLQLVTTTPLILHAEQYEGGEEEAVWLKPRGNREGRMM